MIRPGSNHHIARGRAAFARQLKFPLAAATEDVRVQQQRYTLGASTLLDLLTSQSTLDAARSALIQARQDFRVARAQLEALVGRELQ